MKWLFVGDASNMHNTLAAGLRSRGHDCVVVSDGSRWMDTARDVDLTRGKGVSGTVGYVARLLWHMRSWRGYDVVVLCGHHFLSLKPARLRPVLDTLKRNNRLVVLSALGTDIVYYRACHDGVTFRYSDYRLGDKPSPYVGSNEYHAQHQENWQLPSMVRYGEHLLDTIDGAVTALYEYHAAYEAQAPDIPLAYAGIPIETSHYTPHTAYNGGLVRFFIGVQRDRTVVKGTDRLLEAARRVVSRRPREAELIVAENVPFERYVSMMSDCHVLLDQIYSYTPATNALLAMSLGLVAVTGGEPEYYDFIGERELRPIVNVDPTVPDDIDRRLEWIVDHRDELTSMGDCARHFVVRHNDVSVVVERWLNFINNLCERNR